MVSDGGFVPLRDLCNAIVDCEHKTAPTQSEGIPSIRTTDIQNGRLNILGANRVSEATYRDWTVRIEPRPGDLILAREAPVGEVGIVPPGTRVCLGQRTVLLRVDPSKAVPRYLLYKLLTPEMRHELKRRAEGSTVAHLNVRDIRNLAIPALAPLEDQRRIASILGALDDKIDLNCRVNRTLQQVAEALFESWFVEFDPVRAKAEGHWKESESLPGMPADMWDLWPSEFEESEIGEIPMGWRVSTVGTETETVLGGTPSRTEPSYWSKGTINWVNSGAVNDFRIIKPSERITEEALKNSAAEVLPPHTTVLAITGATIGQVSISEIPTTTNQSVVAILQREGLPTEFIYFWVRNRMSDLLARQTGGAQQHINKNDVNDLILLVPNTLVMARFLNVSGPLFSQIRNNEFESLTLAKTRDSLLPKLLSGEVRVPVEGGT